MSDIANQPWPIRVMSCGVQNLEKINKKKKWHLYSAYPGVKPAPSAKKRVSETLCKRFVGQHSLEDSDI